MTTPEALKNYPQIPRTSQNHIDGQDASEGAFIFRTGSYNSGNDFRVRLQSLYAGFGKNLHGGKFYTEHPL